MPECTKEERTLLDALAEKKDIFAARFALALSSVPPELIESYVSARARVIQANAHFEKIADALWSKFETRDGDRVGSLLSYRKFDGERDFYDELEARAQELAKR